MPALVDYDTKPAWKWTTATTAPTAKPAATTGELPDFFGRTPEAAASGVLSPINFAKIPGMDPLLKEAASSVTGLGPMNTLDLSKYRMAVEGTQPDIDRYTGEEVADIGRVYSPAGYETDLAGIRNRRMQALSALQGRLFGDLRKQMGLDVIGSPASGLNSYLAERAGSTAARIREQAIADAAAQEREDMAALMAARAAQQGRRGLLTEAQLARVLAPGEQDLKFTGARTDLLNRILQGMLQNSDVGYATPV